MLRADPNFYLFRSRLVRAVCLYFIMVAISSILGVAPVVSLFGSHFNYMGLVTRLCFFILFIALIIGIGLKENRLRITLWSMAITGFLVATYAVAQSFYIEPFVSRSLYTFDSPSGPLVRVCATLGHSNYLGNFLLYTTPMSMGLALASRGWLRLFAAIAIGLSLTAIAISGTRGAWVGIITGMASFAFLELKGRAANSVLTRSRRRAGAASMISAVLLVSIIAISPLSRNITARVRALMTEGLTGSGRTLLWRDSMSMIPSFAFIGCGPEGFRKAFLDFKSKELARLSPKANNESSHNSYLDAAISYGLLGVTLYIEMIVLVLALLTRARHRAKTRSWRIIITGLVSSFVAVLVHNIFIFDQIATGLYFFAFVALAQVTSSLSDQNNNADIAQPVQPVPQTHKNSPARVKHLGAPRRHAGWRGRLITAAACLCVVAAIWYSVRLVDSDMAYKELFNPANPVDFNGLVRQGERVTSSPHPSRAYDFLFARAIYLFVEQLPAASNSTGKSQPSDSDLSAIRAEALKLATIHVEKSLVHTVTPESNYLLLGTLAMAAGDIEKLHYAASEAVKWDSNNYYTRWLMAQAYLARAEVEQAVREAETALEVNPADDYRVARIGKSRRSVEKLITIARNFSQGGKLQKARIKLLTAIDRAEGSCPDGHHELAIVYEKMGRYSDAIAEWETLIKQVSERAAAEQIKEHIEALKQKSNPK